MSTKDDVLHSKLPALVVTSETAKAKQAVIHTQTLGLELEEV